MGSTLVLCFYFESDNIASFAIEFRADQVNGLCVFPVFLGIAFVFDLLQGASVGDEFDDFEFEDVDLMAEFYGHVDSAVIRGIFECDV